MDNIKKTRNYDDIYNDLITMDSNIFKDFANKIINYPNLDDIFTLENNKICLKNDNYDSQNTLPRSSSDNRKFDRSYSDYSDDDEDDLNIRIIKTSETPLYQKSSEQKLSSSETTSLQVVKEDENNIILQRLSDNPIVMSDGESVENMNDSGNKESVKSTSPSLSVNQYDDNNSDYEEKEEQEEVNDTVNDTVYDPLKIVNVINNTNQENETGNGGNSCWINACLYLFLAHQQVIDKCKELDFPNDEMYEPLKKIHQEFLKLRDNSVGENNESDPNWNETFYLKVKNYIKNYGESDFNINSKYYSKDDMKQYSEFLENANDYNDLKLSLVYIFPLMIKYNFQQLDLIIFNSGELCYGGSYIKPCNLFNFLFPNHLYFLGNNDKKLTLEIPLIIKYSENNTLFDILTNKFTLKKEKNALTQQLFGNNSNDFGTYECVGFVISRDFVKGNNTNVGHYVTYVKTGNSSKNTWIRWDALEINKVATQEEVQKVFEIKKVNDIDDIYKYEFYQSNGSEKKKSDFTLDDFKDTYRPFIPLFLRIDGDENLDNDDLLTKLFPIQSVKFEIESNYRKTQNFFGINVIRENLSNKINKEIQKNEKERDSKDNLKINNDEKNKITEKINEIPEKINKCNEDIKSFKSLNKDAEIPKEFLSDLKLYEIRLELYEILSEECSKQNTISEIEKYYNENIKYLEIKRNYVTFEEDKNKNRFTEKTSEYIFSPYQYLLKIMEIKKNVQCEYLLLIKKLIQLTIENSVLSETYLKDMLTKFKSYKEFINNIKIAKEMEFLNKNVPIGKYESLTNKYSHFDDEYKKILELKNNKKGGKRKTKKNRKRKTNKKLNKLSNNSSNKKRIKKKKSLKH